MASILRSEAQIPALWLTVAVLTIFGEEWLSPRASAFVSLMLFAWFFIFILWGAFAVVRHAEELAERLGEPLGTLVLTLSVTVIEVTFIVTALVEDPVGSTIVRDTIFSVLMITLNGIIGLCLLLGALRHTEQHYNLQGTQAFLALVIPLSVFALVLPDFTTSTPGPTLSYQQAIVLAALTLLLYFVFLAMQTVRHRGYFQEIEEHRRNQASVPLEAREAPKPARSAVFHTLALLLTLLPVVYLTEELSHVVGRGIAALEAPQTVAGLVVAVLVLAPEGMGALRAALRNQLQRAVNITLGSALATIGLTIPAVLFVSVAAGVQVTLGLPSEEVVLLALTLMVSLLTFGGQRTHVLLGAVHLVMFLVFVLLLFDP